MKGVKVVAHPYIFPETAMVAVYLKYTRWARCSLCGNLPLNIIKSRGKSVLEKSSLCIVSSSAGCQYMWMKDEGEEEENTAESIDHLVT